MPPNHNGVAMLDQNQNTIIQKDNSEFVIVQIMLIQFLILFFNKKLQIYNPKIEL